MVYIVAIRFINKTVNTTKLMSVEPISQTDNSILNFVDTITHAKQSILLNDELEETGHIEVFNEIFPLAAFGI